MKKILLVLSLAILVGALQHKSGGSGGPGGKTSGGRGWAIERCL